MSRYAVYELFGSSSAPGNLVSCGYLAGSLVGTCDDNPLEPIVRCKECVHAHKSDYARGRSLVCDLGEGDIVGPDDFCSWAEPIEDGDSDGKGQD